MAEDKTENTKVEAAETSAMQKLGCREGGWFFFFFFFFFFLFLVANCVGSEEARRKRQDRIVNTFEKCTRWKMNHESSHC